MTTTVTLDNVELPPETKASLEEEFTKAGIGGVLWIGELRVMPEYVYLLWHAPGEVPVTMTTRRSDLNPPELPAAIESFMSKWHRRLQ